MNQNRFKRLREEESDRRRDKNPKCELFTQEKLSKELLEKCNYYISSSKIKKLETDTDGVKVDAALLLAYKKFFHVSVDWLIDSNVNTQFLDGDVAIASKTTGLSDDAIKTLSQLKEGNNTDTLFNTLNYIISKNPALFARFIDAIDLYFDAGFDTPMEFKGSCYIPIDDGISNNPILSIDEKSVAIGKYDPSLCNNTGGYHTRTIPISILKEAYSLQAIESILNYLKDVRSN